MKTLISILAGIVTHSVLITYLADRTTCAAKVTADGVSGPRECVMRVLPDFHITWSAEAWRITYLPGFAIPAVAALLVGLILWAAWARRQLKTLIFILAGIATHSVVFTYLGDSANCAARGRDVQMCRIRVLPDFHLTWDGGTWPITFLPVHVIAAVAGLLVGLILWAAWARSRRSDSRSRRARPDPSRTRGGTAEETR